ncbi:MAG TPA: MBL fold metallo-hydrolase [Candidatus Nitrosotenuis sp.]
MKILYIMIFLFGFATSPAFSQPTTDTIGTEPSPASHDGLLSVVFVDLQTKGESILVIFPNGKTMLIDGGMPSSYPKLESVLKQHNISEIDVMVGTHADQDHIAGLTKVLDDSDFTVKQVFISYVPSSTLTYQNFLNELSDNGLQSQAVFDGHVIDLDSAVTAKIISPPIGGIQDGPSASLSNSNSLVTLLEYGSVSFLLTADATHTTESWIVQNHPDLDIDIMNGPHHGSKYSSTDAFIDHLTPQLVIFSADQNNEYGHPHQEVIDEYQSRGINHYQTGLEGSIVIKTDGVGCSLILEGEPEQPCYSGIQVVPEFPLVLAILFASVFVVVLFSKFVVLRNPILK